MNLTLTRTQWGLRLTESYSQHPDLHTSTSIIGLVVEFVVAIDEARVRFTDDAQEFLFDMIFFNHVVLESVFHFYGVWLDGQCAQRRWLILFHTPRLEPRTLSVMSLSILGSKFDYDRRTRTDRNIQC